MGAVADEKSEIPLVVDLDGSLLKSDLLYESFFDALSRNGWRVATTGLLQNPSRQGLKSHLSRLSHISYEDLPYDDRVLELIAKAKAEGRKVYLATASNEHHARSISDQLGLFDGVFASDETINLKGRRKAEALVAAFGIEGFDYVGNDASDIEIWKHSRIAYSIGLPDRVSRRLTSSHREHRILGSRTNNLSALIAAMRPHQYAKNALIFVPLLTAHQFNLPALIDAVLAFIAFCLCASGVYILNDLLDIQSDRTHPTKKNRPFASGQLPLTVGIAAFPILTLLSFAIAWTVSFDFFISLAVYYALTNAYSFDIKKRMLADVVVLASLYTIRVFAGAMAIDVHVSSWLFTFSLLIFTSLALIKRYIELSVRLDRQLSDPSNRNYKVADLPVIMALAAAAGMNSIMVIALYVSSDEVARLYSKPHLLWGLCPLFLYWISRVLMLANRRLVNDDPITFALKDSRSWAVVIASIALVLLAI